MKRTLRPDDLRPDLPPERCGNGPSRGDPGPADLLVSRVVGEPASDATRPRGGSPVATTAEALERARFSLLDVVLAVGPCGEAATFPAWLRQEDADRLRVALTKPRGGGIRIRTRDDVIVLDDPPDAPAVDGGFLFSTRTALTRAGVPETGPDGAPVSDGGRALWAAEEVLHLRRELERLRAKTAEPPVPRHDGSVHPRPADTDRHGLGDTCPMCLGATVAGRVCPRCRGTR